LKIAIVEINDTESGNQEVFDDDQLPICNVDGDDQSNNFQNNEDEEEDHFIPLIEAQRALEHLMTLSKYLLNAKIDPIKVHDLKDLVYSAKEKKLLQTRISDFTII
jgi:hypothetical protein